MSTNNTHESRLNKIRALLRMTVENGCTQEEANTAFITAQKMMNSFSIAKSEVEMESKEDEKVSWQGADLIVRHTPWVSVLARTIASNFRCEYVYTIQSRTVTKTVPKGKRMIVTYASGEKKLYTEGQTYTINSAKNSQLYKIQFFGEKKDSEVAAFLFEQAVNAGRALAAEVVKETLFIKGDGITPRKVELGYLEGFAYGLQQAFRDAVSSDTALVRMTEVPEHVREAYKAQVSGSMTHGKSYRNTDSRAYNAGMQDGRAFGSSQKQSRGGTKETRRLGV